MPRFLFNLPGGTKELCVFSRERSQSKTISMISLLSPLKAKITKYWDAGETTVAQDVRIPETVWESVLVHTPEFEQARSVLTGYSSHKYNMNFLRLQEPGYIHVNSFRFGNVSVHGICFGLSKVGDLRDAVSCFFSSPFNSDHASYPYMDLPLKYYHAPELYPIQKTFEAIAKRKGSASIPWPIPESFIHCRAVGDAVFVSTRPDEVVQYGRRVYKQTASKVVVDVLARQGDGTYVSLTNEQPYVVKKTSRSLKLEKFTGQTEVQVKGENPLVAVKPIDIPNTTTDVSGRKTRKVKAK